MTKIVGKNGISAEVVQHSINEDGKEIITYNLRYGLIVHAEFLRHRLFSNSVASNRAIPMKKVREQVLKDPYIPVWFGAKQKGMVSDNEMPNKKWARRLWLLTRYPACFAHWVTEKMGAHKEWASRMLNPWQFVTQTTTATEWANFNALRLDRGAQKDIQELARVMAQAANESRSQGCVELLGDGEYHVPYVKRERGEDGKLYYLDNDGRLLSTENAIKASVARCARSSYNNHDKSDANFENDVGLYNTLITSKPTHGSPAEHVATPMYRSVDNAMVWDDGVTHVDSMGRYWSGNLVDWVQYRQTLNDHVEWEDPA